MLRTSLIFCLVICLTWQTVALADGTSSSVETMSVGEFSQLIPWYNLEEAPLGLQLRHIARLTAESNRSIFLVSYATGELNVTVNITGEFEKIILPHGPSEFELRYPSASSQATNPWLSSIRTDVRLSLVGDVDPKDTAYFLQRVILHPGVGN